MDMNKKLKNGFSLSENLTVLFVLGIIIAITIPKLVASRTERNNRLIVRKSIVTYQKILDNELVKATGLSTTADMNTRLRTTANDCSVVTRQLTLSQNNMDCTFTTEDGIQWNLKNPSDAIISIKNLEPTYANAQADNRTVFYIPFAVKNRAVKVLNFDNTVNNLNNKSDTVNKTRDFIIGE